jgi:hypothetical protein
MAAAAEAFAVIIAAAVVLLAVPAAAIDGEILIDQTKVNAGGITPGDAPGFPATLGRSGRYKLAGNLAVPAGQDGIKVAADNVAIDLNGFMISGAQAGIGVRAADPGGNPALHPDGVSIRNGTVAGFTQVGIYVAGRFAVIENMRIVSSGAAISTGDSSRISRSTVANNQFGVSCGAGCLVEQNMISGSSSASGNGIELFSGTVLGNVAVANNGAGVRCFSFGTGCGYGDNVLVGNNGGGAQVEGPIVQLHPNVCDPPCP